MGRPVPLRVERLLPRGQRALAQTEKPHLHLGAQCPRPHQGSPKWLHLNFGDHTPAQQMPFALTVEFNLQFSPSQYETLIFSILALWPLEIRVSLRTFRSFMWPVSWEFESLSSSFPFSTLSKDIRSYLVNLTVFTGLPKCLKVSYIWPLSSLLLISG